MRPRIEVTDVLAALALPLLHAAADLKLKSIAANDSANQALCACVCQLRQVVYPVVNRPTRHRGELFQVAATNETLAVEDRVQRLATEGCPHAIIDAAAGGNQELLKVLNKSIEASASFGWSRGIYCWYDDYCSNAPAYKSRSNSGIRVLSIPLVGMLVASALLVQSL